MKQLKNQNIEYKESWRDEYLKWICAFANSQGGELPFGLTQEELKNSHRSKPRNKNIANVFYKAGFVESWGRGIQKICNQFAAAHLPEPVVGNFCGGVNVVVPRNNPEVTMFSKEYLHYFKTESVREQVKSLLVICDGEKSKKELMSELLLKGSRNFLQNYLQPALESQFIEQTNPDSPNSPNQKYRLTSKGIKMKELILKDR